MNGDAKPYEPISCDFHDLLEDLATTRRWAQFRFVDEAGLPQQRQAKVLDLRSRDRVEYMVLSNGEEVRLDRLVAVDQSKLADFS